MDTVNWKIFELKIFHKNIRVKKFRSYTGGLEKFLRVGRKVTSFEQLRNSTACERSSTEEFGRDCCI